MNIIQLDEIHLMGLSLKSKTTNINGQSMIDCGNLWQEFQSKNYDELISDKLSDEILAVYHQYEGDYTRPFSYFIGYKVASDQNAQPGIDKLTIPGGSYEKIVSKGKMPDCLVKSWKEIWNMDIPRAYNTDFEIYDEKSKDWNDAEVQIFLSIK